jgi:hypothetical protein
VPRPAPQVLPGRALSAAAPLASLAALPARQPAAAATALDPFAALAHGWPPGSPAASPARAARAPPSTAASPGPEWGSPLQAPTQRASPAPSLQRGSRDVGRAAAASELRRLSLRSVSRGRGCADGPQAGEGRGAASRAAQWLHPAAWSDAAVRVAAGSVLVAVEEVLQGAKAPCAEMGRPWVPSATRAWGAAG